MADRAGQQLGNYQLIRLLGEGGFAEVYLGEHLYLKSYAAVKVLHASLSEKQREDFLTEAQRLMSLRHPHIVRILDFAVEGDVPFFVMEYAPHGTLRTLHPKGSRLQLETVIPYVKQVADALQYIHEQKLVHRDVKPENMLLAANQDILLSDLGIAALAYTTGSIIAQGLAGTIPYMAPEQIMELPRPASDQYSLGVVVYEWLCGTRPFQGTELRIAYQHLSTPPPALREHIPTIASAVEQVVLKALAKEPQQRFAHVAAFASALEQAWQAAKRDALSPPTVTAPLNMNASATQLFDSTYMASQPNVAPQSWAPNVPPSQSLSPERRKLSSSQSSRPATVPPASYPPRETRRTPLSPPRRSRSARRRDIIVAILALLTLLSLIFLGYFAVTLSGSTHTPSGTTSDDTRTAGAHNPPTQQPTPTPTPNQMATAQVTATATAQAQGSATAGVIQTATAGQPIYQDALNNPNNPTTQAAAWDGADGSNSHCGFQSDGYHVQQELGLGNLRGCHEAAHAYKNATISIDVNILSGSSGGLFFRLSTDTFGNYDSYLFEVTTQGQYKISLVTGSVANALSGHDWTATSVLKTGNNVKNTLQVIMRDNTFLFYINGTFLTSATDATYSSAGLVGFLATIQTSKADIVYSNLKVYPLS